MSILRGSSTVCNLFSEDITGMPFVETIPAPTHLLLPAEFGNGLIATTEGGEIASEWQPKNFWRLRASYSFLEMHVEKAPGSMDIGTAASVQGSSPQHELLIQSSLDLPKSVTADFQIRYVSQLPALMVPAYWTGDLSLGYSLTKHLRLSVVGQNLSSHIITRPFTTLGPGWYREVFVRQGHVQVAVELHRRWESQNNRGPSKAHSLMRKFQARCAHAFPRPAVDAFSASRPLGSDAGSWYSPHIPPLIWTRRMRSPPNTK